MKVWAGRQNGEITAVEWIQKKIMKNETVSETWNNIKHTNIPIIEVTEEEEKVPKMYLKEIIAKKLP